MIRWDVGCCSKPEAMRKLSILLPHFKAVKWLAIAVHAFKKYQPAIPWELVVCNNSPWHPSIKILTETHLGEDVKIVDGQADFPSHGKGLFFAYQASDLKSDWIMTTESDAFPIRDNWSNEFIKASANYDLVGPEMKMGGGTYIHPCGAIVRRSVLEAHQQWRDKYANWKFLPGAAPALGLSEKGYHVVAHESFLEGKDLPFDVQCGMRLWEPDVGPWQSMIEWDDDSFDSYWKRDSVKNWTPTDKKHHLRIGLEPGCHLAWWAQGHGFRCLKAPTHVEWMKGRENAQASYSDVFGGFRHVWAGTSAFCDGIPEDTKQHKMQQMEHYFSQLPEDIQKKCLELDDWNA
jgi:hypothetical protein